MNIFDSKIVNLKQSSIPFNHDSLSVFQLVNRHTNTSLITLWNKANRPADSFKPQNSKFQVLGTFEVSVYIHMISGNAYRIPDRLWKKIGSTYQFANIPIPDYPILIADINAVLLKFTNKKRIK